MGHQGVTVTGHLYVHRVKDVNCELMYKEDNKGF